RDGRDLRGAYRVARGKARRRPPFMPVRGCKPLRRVGKIVVTLSPAAAWTYFDIAGNALARRGSDCVSSSRLCESHNSGLQKSSRWALRCGAETSPGSRVGDPALVLPTVPVLAQMVAAFTSGHALAWQRKTFGERQLTCTSIISNPGAFTRAWSRFELVPRRRLEWQICVATALVVHSDPWPITFSPLPIESSRACPALAGSRSQT